MKLNIKYYTCAAVVVFLCCVAGAQTISNGGFENWNASSYETPHFYSGSSNFEVWRRSLPFNVTKVADPQQGTFAVQLQTVASANDTMFGYFINGSPDDGSGGIPYNQQATALTGFYKCNIPAGDTALILVFFKLNGSIISMDFGKFSGTHSTYTAFTMPLNVPVTPDSVIIGAASSNAFAWNGIPGSMFQLDNIAFTGVTGQPAQLNGSFETWDPHTIYQPAQWALNSDSVVRTTDAHSGTYALELKTHLSEDNFVNSESATNGLMPLNMGPMGGQPYSQMTDTLYGWYKYAPAGTDNGYVWVNLTQNGNTVGGGSVMLAGAPSWALFTVPLSASIQPDTLLIEFRSSAGNPAFSNLGSTLKVDDVYLQSSPLGTPYSWSALSRVQLSPNPAAGGTTVLEWSSRDKAPVTIRISDMNGKLIAREEMVAGVNCFVIETSALEKGVYLVTLEQGGSRVSRKLVVE